MKIALVGTGGIAHTHAKAIAAAGHQLALVHDIDPERAAAFALAWKTRAAATEAEVLAPDIDVVAVTVPNRFHFDVSAKALQAGRAVLCEKPLTGDPARSRELAALAARAGRPLFVGYMKRAHPVMQRFHGYAARIGGMRTGLVRVHLPCALSVWDDIAANLRKDPRDPRHQDGILAMVASHVLDLLLWVAGPVKRVIGARQQYRPGVATMDSEAHALLEMANGASVALDCAFLPLTGIGRRENGWDEGIELRGDAGLARIATPWSDRSETDAPAAELWLEATKSWEGSTVNGVDYYAQQYRDINDALAGKPVMLATGEDGARVDELIAEIARVARG